jgi:hypothetical protein
MYIKKYLDLHFARLVYNFYVRNLSLVATITILGIIYR